MVLALALLALVGAASASAALFKSETEGATMKGSHIGAKTSLSLNGETWQCGYETEFKADPISGGSSSELTVDAWSPGCQYIGLQATWQGENKPGEEDNPCKYRLHAGTNQSMTGWMDIEGCELGALVFQNAFCKVEIPEQEFLGPVQYTNEGSGSSRTFKMAIKSRNVTFTRTGGCFGPAGTFHGGEYSGEWNVSGPKGVWVEPTAPAGTGFATQVAPAKVTGNRTAAATGFSLNPIGLFTCKKHTLTGETASTLSGSLVLSPSYGECQFSGYPLSDNSFSMGGCSYEFNPVGGVSIVGATCASNPITIDLSPESGSPLTCKITIGPQSGLSGLKYAEEGWGPSRVLARTGNATGLTFNAAGTECLGYTGTFNTGVFGIKSGSNPVQLSAADLFGNAQGLWMN